MNIQYRFQLVFLRLTLKRNILSDSNLKITLLKAKKEQSPASLQTQEIKIKKHQKIIDLDSIKTFNFSAAKKNQDHIFTIKYEIKGIGEDRVRTIPINIIKMIQEYQSTKKGAFQQAFGGEYAQISYKFYLTPLENQQQPLNLAISLQNKEQSASHGDPTKLANSINRSKRPPGLNLQKRASKSPKPSQQEPQHSPQKNTIRQMFSQGIPSLISPISPEISKKTFIKLNSVDHDQFNSSISGVQKKISSLPLSEIQKVNELIATHHRPHSQFHHQAFHLSYKLKIVIIMLVIGIAFLLFDTLSDRKSKKAQKAQNQHGDQHHGETPHHQQEKHKKGKGKHQKHKSHAKNEKEVVKNEKKKTQKQVQKQKKH